MKNAWWDDAVKFILRVDRDKNQNLWRRQTTRFKAVGIETIYRSRTDGKGKKFMDSRGPQRTNVNRNAATFVKNILCIE